MRQWYGWYAVIPVSGYHINCGAGVKETGRDLREPATVRAYRLGEGCAGHSLNGPEAHLSADACCVSNSIRRVVY
jgi:hypothetical protein